MKGKTLWVVQTGVMLALLVVVQWATKPLGTLVTGSAVNFVLIAAVLLAGMWSGLIVAVVSPFLAMLLGIVPLPIYIVPVVALGNAVLVVVYALVLKRMKEKSQKQTLLLWGIAIAGASLLKFAALYAGVNWLVAPLVTAVTGAPAKAPAAIFSASQMLTAAIGGVLAALIVPRILKAVRKD